MIKKIQEETEADISIEDDGTVYITGEKDGAEKARATIEALTHEYTPGEKYDGEVTKIIECGAIVKIGPNTEGLVHISEIAPFRIEKVENVLKVGEAVPIVVKEVNKREGKISLSIKSADPDFAKKKGIQPQDNSFKGNGDKKQQYNKKFGG